MKIDVKTITDIVLSDEDMKIFREATSKLLEILEHFERNQDIIIGDKNSFQYEETTIAYYLLKSLSWNDKIHISGVDNYDKS